MWFVSCNVGDAKTTANGKEDEIGGDDSKSDKTKSDGDIKKVM